MKKTNIIATILTIFIIITALVAITCKELILWSYVPTTAYRTRAYVDNFEQFRYDFNVVAEFIAEDHAETKELEYSPTYDNSKDRYIDIMRMDNFTKIPVPKDVNDSLKVIKDEFSDDRDVAFTYIEYRDGNIIFQTDWGNYAIVYSPDNVKIKKIRLDDLRGLRYAIQDFGVGWYSISSNR
jgi:hypothetical protein